MNKIKNFLIKREQSQACLSFAKREKSRLLAKTILTLVALLAVTTGAWATDAYEEFTTTASWTSYDQTADHFRVTGSYGFPQGLSIGSSNNYSITIAALNSETISKVEMTIGDMGSWNDGNVISSTAGSVSGSYAVNGTITVDNPNASTVTLSAGERYLLIKTLKVYYTEGSSASAVTVAWNKATKTGTFKMPGGNVELEPEYYPQAALTAQPTAINDVPATTDGAIVNAGTVKNIGETATAQGTVMYYVSTTALDDAALLALTAEAWKADVPTAESLAAGTAYVYYYVRGNDSDTDEENFSDGDILSANALTVNIAAEPTYAVTFKAANANTIEAGKATVTVGGKAATVTEGKLQGVKMGSEVKVKAATGYKFKKVEVKKAKAAVAYTMAKDATAADKGKLICADGHIHANGEDATCTAARVAKIIYIGTTGHTTYTHGLALALTDEGQMAWEAAKTACNTTKNTNTPVTDATWLLASKDQWDYMLGANGAGSYTALRDGFSGITGASNLQSGFYWSSTEKDASTAWRYWFYGGNWNDAVTKDHALTYVRACLAF